MRVRETDSSCRPDGNEIVYCDGCGKELEIFWKNEEDAPFDYNGGDYCEACYNKEIMTLENAINILDTLQDSYDGEKHYEEGAALWFAVQLLQVIDKTKKETE